MHFTSPMPEEAVRYYREKDFDHLDEIVKLTEPFYLPENIGTGPHMITKRKKRQEIILERNPLFRDEFYPSAGMPEDKERGLLDDAGKRLPFADRIRLRISPLVTGSPSTVSYLLSIFNAMINQRPHYLPFQKNERLQIDLLHPHAVIKS